MWEGVSAPLGAVDGEAPAGGDEAGGDEAGGDEADGDDAQAAALAPRTMATHRAPEVVA
ncbi:MAG: hypothetical protein ACOC9O_03610 [Myxococcota bacterium]